MRISSQILLLLLAACSKGEEARQAAAGDEASDKIAEKFAEDDMVPCALAGAKDFRPVCKIDKAKGERPGEEVWVVRHVDGGFRRFVIIEKGGEVRIATADGNDEVQGRRLGPNLEVKVGDDRYLFAATPEPAAPEPAANAPAD